MCGASTPGPLVGIGPPVVIGPLLVTGGGATADLVGSTQWHAEPMVLPGGSAASPAEPGR